MEEMKLVEMRLKIESLEKDRDQLAQRVDEMERLDRSRMRAAVVALGGAVLALLGYIAAPILPGGRP